MSGRTVTPISARLLPAARRSVSSVSSNGTMASAPLGTGAPVMMRTAVPGVTSSVGSAPAATEPKAAAAAEPDVSDEGDGEATHAEVVAEADATVESDVTLPPDFNFPTLPSPEPPDDEVTDPCTPSYEAPADCIGVEAPAFTAYDFQPQSCGYGATYGLDVFRGTVTFVALLASW